MTIIVFVRSGLVGLKGSISHNVMIDSLRLLIRSVV